MPPNVFVGHVTGDFLPAADWNSNWTLTETSFLGHGAYVVSGLTVTAGTGLSVNVAAGHAIIGADINFASPFVIGSLADNNTNHLFVLQNGSGTSNITGTAPANSAKIGTAVTLAGVVTVVAMGRTSGRQQFVQPQNLISGGPAAGTTSAGHPASVNLAGWAAAAAEGVPVFGVLPAGAVPATTVPVTYTLNDANQNSVQTVLTVAHTYNAGGGATGIGSAIDLVAESATNATTKVVASVQAALTDATAATATGRLSVNTIANNAQVTPLTVAGQDIRIPQAPAASAQHGLLNIGSGGFDGSANHFAGDSPGTYLAMNAPSGYAGTYLDVQKAGARLLYLDQFGTLFRLSAPVGTANDGQLSLGPDFAHFDGASTGKFAGSASGTYLAINTETGFAGDLARFQHHGSDRYRQTDTGDVTITDRDAGTTNAPNVLSVQHKTSGTPAANFGAVVQVQLDNASNAVTHAGSFTALWSAATAGSESSILIGKIRLTGTDTECMRLRPVGLGQLQATNDFFHANASGSFGAFGVGPVGKQTGASAAGIAAVTDVNARNALTALQAALANLGFITSPA